jgi:membrane fusion protein
VDDLTHRSFSKTRRDATPLFRPEALARRQSDTSTGIVLSLGRGAGAVHAGAWVSAALLLLATVMACRVDYSRKIHMSAWLLPDEGLLRLYPPQDGTVTRSNLVEGSHVKKGDILFVISSERRSTQLGLMSAVERSRLKSTRASLERERMKLRALIAADGFDRDQKILNLRNQLLSVEKQKQLGQERVDLERSMAKRYQNLVEQNLASISSLEQKQAGVLDVERTAMETDRAVLLLQSEIESVQTAYRDSTTERLLRMEAIDRDLTALDKQNDDRELRDSLDITAPVDATISSRAAWLGSVVKATIPIVVLVPDGARLRVHALADPSASAHIRPGQRLAIEYERGDARPIITEVSDISSAPLGDSEIAVKFGLRDHPPAYEVIASWPKQLPDDSQYFPRLGMELSGDVYTEKRPIILWILGPLLHRF